MTLKTILTPEQARQCAQKHGWETLLALEGMLAEWDKFTRYGSPMAKAANERVNYARRAAAKARGDA